MGTFGGSDFGINDFTGQTGRGPVQPSDIVSRSAANIDRTERAEWASEDEYWRNHYGSRPYARADLGYDHYQPAYRYGYESANRLGHQRWEEVESELQAGWEADHGTGERRGAWASVRDAVKDAWDRVTGHSTAR